MSSDASQLLAAFWPRMMTEIRTKPLQMPKTGSKKDEPIQELPLARIKKIMKQDGDVKMISAEAPILFSRAAEIFISELSIRAWIHTEDNKRRTLQRNDIAMAITKYDQFDFLIDIVPRDELKPTKRPEEAVRQQSNIMAPEQVQYYFQLSQLQQQQGGSTPTAPQATQLPAGAHIIQQPNGQVIIAAPHQLTTLTGSTGNSQPQIIQIAPDQQQQQQNTNTASQQQQNANEQSNVEQQIIQSSVANQTQFSGAQQLHYIRIPQTSLQSSAGGNLTQVIQLQQLQQQQANNRPGSTNQNADGRQQDGVYSQIYQPVQGGLPAGAVYVMTQPPSTQVVTGANQTQ